MGNILLIIIIFAFTSLVDLPNLVIKKKKKEMVLFVSAMVVSLALSIYIILSAVDLPSISTFYKRIYDPIIFKQFGGRHE